MPYRASVISPASCSTRLDSNLRKDVADSEIEDILDVEGISKEKAEALHKSAKQYVAENVQEACTLERAAAAASAAAAALAAEAALVTETSPEPD